MERTEIINLSKKKITIENLDKAKQELSRDYEISYGTYDAEELKKSIQDKKPFFMQNHMVIGYNPDGTFAAIDKESIKIDKMIKAIIIEEEKSDPAILEESMTEDVADRPLFAILGKTEWTDMESWKILSQLRVGSTFLPPHSAIFNFINPTDEIQKEKIVSCLEGVNINVYQKENCFDNCIHEIGHLFWRDCLKFEDRKAFKEYFKHLKPSALYEYDWEKSDPEEVFCTAYKWYVKSILLNKSFYNILEFEDPFLLQLLQKVLYRISKERLIDDIWELKKDDVSDYLNPRIERATGRKIVRKGVLEEIKDIELPEHILNDVDRFQNGTMFVKLNKAVVPVKNRKILWEEVKR